MRRRGFYLLLLSLLIACNNPLAPGFAASEPLFGDEDLLGALSVTALPFESVNPGEVENVSAIPALPERAAGLETTVMNVPAMLAYVRHHPERQYPWNIFTREGTSPLVRHVYAGTREVQSVSASTDGNTVVFALNMGTEAAPNFELFRLRVSPRQLERLTNTPESETHVSISADARLIVWEGNVPGSAQRTVFIREELWTTRQLYLVSSFPQGQPRASSNGAYLTYLRERSENQDIMVYERRSNRSIPIFFNSHNTSIRLSQPSVSNAGRVLWLQQQPGLENLVRSRGLSDASAINLFSDGNRISDPVISPDGSFVAYGITTSESNHLLVRDLRNGQVQRLNISTLPVRNLALSWQEGSALSAITPATSRLRIAQQQTFNTSLAAADADLVWSANGGEIAGSGRSIVYTAPYTPGSYSLTVQSSRDPAQTASVPITVQQPNFVVIVTDDQTHDSIAYMRVLLAEVADKGIRFDNAFVTTSLCCPSRASILTGNYVHNHGVISNIGPQGGFLQFYLSGMENNTVAAALQASGYRTALIGKYMNEYPFTRQPPADGGDRPTPSTNYVPPGWTEWFGLTDVFQFNTPYAMYDYEMNENGTLVQYGTAPEDYLTDVLRDKSLGFIRRSVNENRPFFLFFNPTAPHLPSTPAPRHAHTYPGLTAPRPPSFNEADISDKPQWLQLIEPMTEERIARVDSVYRMYIQTLLALDEAIAELLAELERSGTLDNTYIIFMSDNGLHFGEHRLSLDKNSPYDEATRMPLLLRGPGITPGRRLPQLATNLDLAPTLANLAGLPTQGMDGRSLLPFFRNDNPSDWRRGFLIEHFMHRDRSGQPILPSPFSLTYFGIRTARYLYVEHYYTTGEFERELYDMIEDPYALQNIALSAPADLIGQFSSYTNALRTCQADTCRAYENQPMP